MIDGDGTPDAWSDATLAAACLALDPTGLGGVVLRSPAGPVRDRWLDLMRELLPSGTPMRRLPVHATDGRLLGGLDLAATLGAGRPVAERGLLAEADGGLVVAAMAERMPAATAARLAAVLDSGEVALERDGLALRHAARIGVVALDEGEPAEEATPAVLVERLAFGVDLTALRTAGTEAPAAEQATTVVSARALLASVSVGDDIVAGLAAAADALGVGSIRPVLFAVRAARAIAALAGRAVATPADAALAGRLVLAHRATRLPVAEPPTEQPPEPPPEDASDERTAPPEQTALEDRVVASVEAVLPPGVLARLRAAALRSRATHGGGRSGAQQQSKLRGRPAGVRRGDPRAGDRLNLVATLRAAAPWQRLRRSAPGEARPARSDRVQVRQDDFRVTRFRKRRPTTTVFVVDASGSTALHRLGEAKGAVELLLADCYVRRDRVALIAFRGQGAEILLPPTRSLVRAKRCLASLPGGGGTPLAAGIDAAAALADALRRRGETPFLVFLSDGAANVARDGSHGRQQALADVESAAVRMRELGVDAVVVDTSPRPGPLAERLADAMQARYLPLPRADAAAVSRALAGAVERRGRADAA
jgi:magnesium chelatase subunit D